MQNAVTGSYNEACEPIFCTKPIDVTIPGAQRSHRLQRTGATGEFSSIIGDDKSSLPALAMTKPNSRAKTVIVQESALPADEYCIKSCQPIVLWPLSGPFHQRGHCAFVTASLQRFVSAFAQRPGTRLDDGARSFAASSSHTGCPEDVRLF